MPRGIQLCIYFILSANDFIDAAYKTKGLLSIAWSPVVKLPYRFLGLGFRFYLKRDVMFSYLFHFSASFIFICVRKKDVISFHEAD